MIEPERQATKSHKLFSLGQEVFAHGLPDILGIGVRVPKNGGQAADILRVSRTVKADHLLALGDVEVLPSRVFIFEPELIEKILSVLVEHT